MNGLLKYKDTLPKEVRDAINDVKLMRYENNFANRDYLGRKPKSLYAKFIERISLFFDGLVPNTITWKDMCNDALGMGIDEDAYIRLCKNSKPDDFYFAAIEDADRGNAVYIVPREWFYYSGKEWYCRIDLQHLMPKGIRYYCYGTFFLDISADDITKDMLERGFRQHKEFTDLCQLV